MINILFIILGICVLTTMICSLVAAKLALDAIIKVGSLEKSTHQVQFVPMETPDFEKEFKKAKEEFKNNVADNYDLF